MKRKILLSFVFCFICFFLSAQIPPKGITVKTVRKGEGMKLISDKSGLHKFRVFLGNEDLEFKFIFHKYENGEYKADQELVEIIRHHKISRNTSWSVEIIPEIVEENQLFQVFLLSPGFMSISRHETLNSGKQMKYLFFEYEDKLVADMCVPVLIANEDDNETGEKEKLLYPFVKNGRLIYSSQSDKIIKEQLGNYSLLFYTTKVITN